MSPVQRYLSLADLKIDCSITSPAIPVIFELLRVRSEWADRDVDFEDSEVYRFFCEHSFLFPVFQENEENNPEQTTFLGFKRFGFSDEFIEENVRKTWIDSRHLIHSNSLKWEYELDKNGKKRRNKSGSFKGSPNFPKSSEYIVFFRGGIRCV